MKEQSSGACKKPFHVKEFLVSVYPDSSVLRGSDNVLHKVMRKKMY